MALIGRADADRHTDGLSPQRVPPHWYVVPKVYPLVASSVPKTAASMMMESRSLLPRVSSVEFDQPAFVSVRDGLWKEARNF